MSSTKVVQLADKLEHSERLFQRACLQIVMLNERLSSTSRRYRMAHASGRRSFRYTLRLKLAVIEGLRNVYYEFATLKAQEMQQVRNEAIMENDQPPENDDVIVQ